MIRGKERFLSQVYVFFDIITILLSFLITYWIKFLSDILDNVNHLPFNTYFFWAGIYAIVAVILGFFLKLYVPKRRKRFAYEVFKILQVHVISLLILLSILFAFKEIHISRTFLLVFLFNNIILVSLYRYFVKIMLRVFRKKGYNKQFQLVLGAGTIGRKYYKTLLNSPEFGIEVVGFLDDYIIEHEDKYSHYSPIIGKVDELNLILEKYTIDEVIIALPLTAHKKYKNIITCCEKTGVKTLIIPDFYDYLPARPYIDHFGDILLMNVRDIPLDELINRFTKRSFDIIFSLSVIIILSPILLLLALIIKLTSKGPIIFKQERVGLNRRLFTMYKFRTMRDLPENLTNTQWTTADDPRKTKFGSFLRKTSLDELPQFFNVLFGDMSIVGPRPERPFFVEQFKEEIPKYMIKHHVRPGISGWAQVNGLRGDTSIEDRIKYDIHYIENWTFLFDIKIIFKTVLNGFVNKNAY